MRKYAKSMLGVTLLEIMLVLAIASMVIVMSVRYYQTATASQQANAYVTQVQAIVAASENLAQGQGYAAVNNTTLTPILPTGGLTTPWGTAINVNTTSSATTVTIDGTASTSASGAMICGLVAAKLKASAQFSGTSGCKVVYSP